MLKLWRLYFLSVSVVANVDAKTAVVVDSLCHYLSLSLSFALTEELSAKLTRYCLCVGLAVCLPLARPNHRVRPT